MEKHVEYAYLFDALFTNFGINELMPMSTESELNDFIVICGALEREILQRLKDIGDFHGIRGV